MDHAYRDKKVVSVLAAFFGTYYMRNDAQELIGINKNKSSNQSYFRKNEN
jgi:hypothetical protein